MTMTCAIQTTGLTNGRAANCTLEVGFSPFRTFSHCQMTFLFCCYNQLPIAGTNTDSLSHQKGVHLYREKSKKMAENLQAPNLEELEISPPSG